MWWWYNDENIVKKLWRADMQTDGRTEPFIELLDHSHILVALPCHVNKQFLLLWNKFAIYSTQEQNKHIVVNTDISQDCIIAPVTVVVVLTAYITVTFSECHDIWNYQQIGCFSATYKESIKYPHYCWLLVSPTKRLVPRKASWRRYDAIKYFAVISNIFVVHSV